MDFEYFFPTDCNSLGTIIQDVPSTELHPIEEVIEISTQDELPIVYQHPIQSDGQVQNEPQHISLESHHIVKSGYQCNKEQEELLFEGMIELSSLPNNQNQHHLLKINPPMENDVSINAMYMVHKLETTSEIENTPSSLVIQPVQKQQLNYVAKQNLILSNTNLEFDMESQDTENSFFRC